MKCQLHRVRLEVESSGDDIFQRHGVTAYAPRGCLTILASLLAVVEQKTTTHTTLSQILTSVDLVNEFINPRHRPTANYTKQLKQMSTAARRK